jgi:hypothetical protein
MKEPSEYQKQIMIRPSLARQISNKEIKDAEKFFKDNPTLGGKTKKNKKSKKSKKNKKNKKRKIKSRKNIKNHHY